MFSFVMSLDRLRTKYSASVSRWLWHLSCSVAHSYTLHCRRHECMQAHIPHARFSLRTVTDLGCLAQQRFETTLYTREIDWSAETFCLASASFPCTQACMHISCSRTRSDKEVAARDLRLVNLLVERNLRTVRDQLDLLTLLPNLEKFVSAAELFVCEG